MNSKVFTKRELVSQLGFNEEEAKIILEYQEKLPVLNNNGEGFCVNARTLYLQIRMVKDDSNFSKWFKNIIKRYKFEENVDFTTISQDRLIAILNGGDIKSINYILTLDVAKQICMIERNEIGSLARKYFILMEKAVKYYLEWKDTRDYEKVGYNKMNEALNAHLFRLTGKYADEWDYRYEANNLNILTTGLSAQELRLIRNCPDTITRDSLPNNYNTYLSKMQEHNIIYLNMDIPKPQRYKMLKQTFDLCFPNAIPIVAGFSPERIEKAKEILIKEVEEKTKKYI